MGWLLDPHIWGATPCIKDRPSPRVRPTLRLMSSLKRTATFGLRRAAVRDDRLKSTAVYGRDVHDNACSHIESLNCFGRFGNRLNESDHQHHVGTLTRLPVPAQHSGQ